MTLIALIFVLGYLCIAMEHTLKINKSATALVMGSGLWTLWFYFSNNTSTNLEALSSTLLSVTPIVFFLMAAMTIVAVINAHGGFTVITSRIHTKNIRTLLWQVAWITFFLSAVLDNMTTAIVMVTLTKKLLAKSKDRLYFAGIIIVAANAGGAFSPIGDVTTTMLWLGGQISAVGPLKDITLASVLNLLIPLLVMTRILKGEVKSPHYVTAEHTCEGDQCWERDLIFVVGISALLLAPILKMFLHVPPYLGLMLGLGVLWLLAEVLLRNKNHVEKEHLSIVRVLHTVDMSSLLFFTGILFAVGVLEATGQLHHLAQVLQNALGNTQLITMVIGLLSSVVDNVPLVAASMGMYSLELFPKDSSLWTFMAYCAGTGGSILIIGSAAGVAVMGLEKITFGWYMRRVAPWALLGYFGGAIGYVLMHL